jgi:AcrR family transcriptional regulator
MATRTRLDRAAVVEAAAALGDAAGKEVSLGQLAAHLGVRVPSLYNHIAGQDGLRRKLALYGRRELASCIGKAAIGRSADDAIRAIAHAYRAFARERPSLYAACQRAPDPHDTVLIVASEDVLAILRMVLEAYDLDGDAAIHTIRGLCSAMHGFVTLEAAGGFGIPLDVNASYDHLIDVFINGLPRPA